MPRHLLGLLPSRSWGLLPVILAPVILALAGCVASPGLPIVSGTGYGTPPLPRVAGAVPTAPGVAPAAGAIMPSSAVPPGHGVAILAPLGGPNAERGQALVKAAQLALAVPGSPTLDVRDTGGTPEGAAAAAQAAIAAGAGMIIGPLTGAETAAAAGPAQAAGVPMLAFTNDSSQARPGVWVLGITPGQQVLRVVGAMAAQGKSRIAAILPQTDFGQAMATALGQATAASGLPAPDIHMHSPGPSAVDGVVRATSGYGSRRGPLDAQIRAARNERTAEGRTRAAELARQPIPPPPFDALLLADTGETLATIAALLPYYDIDPPVKILGPALWASPSARSGAPGGALFAAPDPSARSDFNQRYTESAGTAAPGLADFAYDAASIARVLAEDGGFSQASLCRGEGFSGVDGLLALQPDGTVRRGLALFQLQRGAAVMIEPAPDSVTAPGI